jgi:hypothetical protein
MVSFAAEQLEREEICAIRSGEGIVLCRAIERKEAMLLIFPGQGEQESDAPQAEGGQARLLIVEKVVAASCRCVFGGEARTKHVAQRWRIGKIC